MSQSKPGDYPVSTPECLAHLEAVKEEFDLPLDVESRLDDILEQAKYGRFEDSTLRERTAERLDEFYEYFDTRHPDSEDADELREALDDVADALLARES